MTARPKHTPIREQVRSLLEKSGVSQRELQQRSGVPQSRISQYVAGKRDMTTENADALIMALLEAPVAKPARRTPRRRES